MEFPKIRKELKRFMLDEFGGSSKSSILKLGVYSVIAALSSVRVDAGYGNDWCELPQDKCQISCDDAIVDGGTKAIKVEAYLKDDGNDKCKRPKEDNFYDSEYVSGFDYDDIDILSESLGGDDRHMHGRIGFEGFSSHDNSINMNSDDGVITATHDHVIGDACPGTFLEFHSDCNDNNKVRCWCDIYEDGVKQAPADGNDKGHTYHDHCNDCK